VDNEGKDITHIYSYNKVMSKSDLTQIADILNKTNYRVMAWYFGPEDTCKAGVRDVKLLCQMPMHSTGNERFTVYVYIKV
jgi:hypothetical protein